MSIKFIAELCQNHNGDFDNIVRNQLFAISANN